MEFAVDDDGDVASVFQKLHDLGTFAGQYGPAGSSSWVLLQGTEFTAGEAEVHLFQFLLGGGAHAEEFAGEGDVACILQESLFVNG